MGPVPSEGFLAIGSLDLTRETEEALEQALLHTDAHPLKARSLLSGAAECKKSELFAKV